MTMRAFEVLNVPARRRILEILAQGERTSGELVTAIHNEFGISQPAVSQHLGVLRDHGLAVVRRDGTRRYYSIRPEALMEIDAWLESFRGLWLGLLEALDEEVERGKRERAAEPQEAEQPAAGQGEDPPAE